LSVGGFGCLSCEDRFGSKATVSRRECPPFGEQELGVATRQVDHVANVTLRDVNAVQQLGQLADQ
jgi:hypothetical protein